MQPAEEIRTLQRRVELLAPAGRFDVLEAVLDAGADAVYLSGKRFQMRAHRSDFHFSDEALREAIARVHDLGRRVYVTVNTLLSAEETKEIPVYLSFLAEAAVDGIIVCDLATITLARELAVPFELHASTMMNAHDLDQVLMLKDLGCTRIVTSRDISLREAGRLGEQSGLEIEYFVHGDMCVAQSGQCSMSGLLFGKSANRGECMKPCRSAYQLVSLRGEHVSMPLKEGHLMALRDLSLLRQLPEVVEAGICSLKIEGRMRDAEYLAGLVALYRGALDRYYALPSAYQTDSAMLQALFKHRVRELSALSCTGASSTTNFFDISGKREPLILSDGCREPTISTAPVLAAPSNPSTESIQPTPALAVCVASVAATRAAIAAGAGRIYLAAETRQFGEEGWRRETLVEAMDLVQDAGVALGLRTPRVSTSRARAEWRALMDCCRGRNVAFVLAHHFGALKRARENLPGAAIIADYGFNVLNPTAAATLRRLGAHAVMPALEAGFDDVRALVESQAAPLELIVHGPIEGMLLEHCLIAAHLTKHGSKDTCRGPCHHTEFALRDAKGETRLIITDQYCRNHLLTAKDLAILPLLDTFRIFQAESFRIEGQFYTPGHLERITAAYRVALDRWAAETTGTEEPPRTNEVGEGWGALQAEAPRPWNFGGYAQHVTRSVSTAAVMRNMR